LPRWIADSPQQRSPEQSSRKALLFQAAESEALDQTVIEAMVPDLPVLRTAYLIEKTSPILRKSAKQ